MNGLTLQTADIVSLMGNIWMQRVIQAINLLLLVWICSINATLTWNLVAEPILFEVVRTDTDETTPATVEEDPAYGLISQLPVWHLFGEVRGNPVIPEKPPVPLDIPDTSLNLVLRGVLAADDSELARAIVADSKGNEVTHALGDRLSGEATLQEIYPDRIILMRHGRYETLRLSLDDETAEVSSTTNSGLVKPRNSMVRRPGSIHQSMKPYVRSLSQLVKFKTINKSNAVIGYTLHPGSDRDFFERAGLQDGDILTSINGINVNTRADFFRALQSTKDGKPVTMHILRKNQEKKLTFRLP